MNIYDKRGILDNYCGSTKCDQCLLIKDEWSVACDNGCLSFEDSPETDLDKALAIIGYKVDDSVNHPSHYTDGKIEVIDFIEDKKLGFCLGNAVKYISRAGKKDPTKEVEDLKKALWYIERRIKEIEEALV